ncbi:hypothetical protein ABZX93_15160 [Streptomyces sp. NPDC006632]|uniref:hypothetical protein n=2 Tax=unclassified Streptomyces TaxID=2593676 RepID=UPI0033A4BEFB
MATVQPRGRAFPPGSRGIRRRAWVRIRLSARRAIRVSGRGFRGWRTNTNEQRFQKETRDLWVSLDHLGIRGEDLPYTVLAQRSLSMTWGSFLSRGVVAPVASLIITTISVPALALATLNFAHHYGVDNLKQAAGFLYEQWGKVAASSAPGRDPVFAVVANMALLGIPAWVMWRTLRKGVFRKYWLTQRTCAALVRCAQAKTVTGIDRPDRLRQVDSLCRAVEWSIWRSHLWRGGMTRRSPRRGAARHHAAAVIGALHRELGRLDIEPDTSLDDLAKMLATIGEQHAAGYVAALLPAETLEGVTPVSLQRHALRESFAIVRGTVAALGSVLVLDHLLPVLGVRDDLTGWFLAGGALVAAVTAVGWRRVHDFLGVFPGL